MKKILLASLFALLFVPAGHAQMVDNSVVMAIDLQEYLGNRYEIARFDHKFERGQDYCKAQTSDTPAVLRVSFFAPFLSKPGAAATTQRNLSESNKNKYFRI